jgi:predicted ATP-dependent serine protease
MNPPPINYLDVRKMATTEPPKVGWLVEPVLPQGTLVAFYAPGGDGKSLTAAGLAAAIGRGAEVAGLKCQQGTTLYWDAENGPHEIHRRVHALDLPADYVRVADTSRLDLRQHMQVIEAEVVEQRPDLLVIDSFRSHTPGLDENDTAQTARALEPLRRLAHETGTTILLMHHANKGGKDYRGASSIRDAVDVLWHLGRADDDPDRQRRFLSYRKMRVAAEPDTLWLRLEVDRGRVLVDQAEPFDEAQLRRLGLSATS